MTNAAKFLFGEDFRKPAPQPSIISPREVEEAETRGYVRGLQDGLHQASLEVQAHLAATMERLAGTAGMMLSSIDGKAAEMEALAVDFGLTLGRKLAGDALAREPLSTVAEAAAASFLHLRGVPHLVVRVNETLVEPVDQLIKQMARERGFEGRLVTLGEPDILRGDVRLEWADGGIVRTQSQIEQAVAQVVGRP
jgi:flagellar assembly protein FliH